VNTKNVQDHLSLLGKEVEDVVTGMSGIVASVSFDLYGCIQAIINPGLDKDGKPKEQYWYDVTRLKVLKGKPVMEPPPYDCAAVAEGRRGPAEKPTSCKV